MSTGCVSSSEVMKHGLDSFKGQPVQTAINVFGLPDGKMSLKDAEVYIWGNRSVGVYTTTKTAYTSGYVGYKRYSGTTAYQVPVYYEQSCDIKLLCDSSDMILSWEYSGNSDGCMPYAERLLEHLKNSCREECLQALGPEPLKPSALVDECISKNCKW